MGNVRFTLKREELYRMVWTKSTLQLAREYGVNPGTIERACKRMEVPKPKSGFWSSVRGGAPIAPPLPLPLSSNGVPQVEIRIGTTSPEEPNPTPTSDALDPAAAAPTNAASDLQGAQTLLGKLESEAFDWLRTEVIRSYIAARARTLGENELDPTAAAELAKKISDWTVLTNSIDATSTEKRASDFRAHRGFQSAAPWWLVHRMMNKKGR